MSFSFWEIICLYFYFCKPFLIYTYTTEISVLTYKNNIYKATLFSVSVKEVVDPGQF